MTGMFVVRIVTGIPGIMAQVTDITHMAASTDTRVKITVEINSTSTPDI